jgi:hypothetical protein
MKIRNMEYGIWNGIWKWNEMAYGMEYGMAWNGMEYVERNGIWNGMEYGMEWNMELALVLELELYFGLGFIIIKIIYQD